VNVNGKMLYKSEVEELIPAGISPTDSVLTAETYIKMWIKDELMFEKAKANLGDIKKIDELVENYRQSLTIFTYQEQLLNERLSKSISERDLRTYYENNPDQFVLKTNIIKGLFLKVPLISPRLEDLRKWYRSGSMDAIENIEKYSLQNAVIYDYFYDKWVDFDDVMDNIPDRISDPKRFLQTNKTLEIQDSTYMYLLNIKEYLAVGNNAPFEYARGQVTDIVVKQRKNSFIKKFEDDLYNDGLKSGKIKFYNKEE